MQFLAIAAQFLFNILPKVETLTGNTGLSAQVLGAIQQGQAWLGLITDALNDPSLDPLVAAEVNDWMAANREGVAKGLEYLNSEFDAEQEVIDLLKKEREADEAF